MKKIILSDLHFHAWSQFSKEQQYGSGAINSRLMVQLRQFKSAITAHEVSSKIILTGDLFHERGKLKPSVLNPVLKTFNELTGYGYQFFIIPGNHDLEGATSTELSSAVSALKGDNVRVFNAPEYYDGDYYLPWQPTVDETLMAAEKLVSVHGKVGDLFMHAPLDGVVPIPDHGLTPDRLRKVIPESIVPRICCGHYHNHRNLGQGVYSVGALSHQSWNDIGSSSGYMVIDGDDVSHVPQRDIGDPPAPLFVQFDEKNWIKDKDAGIAACSGNYVRLRGDYDVSEAKTFLKEEYGALDALVLKIAKRIMARPDADKAPVHRKTVRSALYEYIDDKHAAMDGRQRKLIKERLNDILDRVGGTYAVEADSPEADN